MGGSKRDECNEEKMPWASTVVDFMRGGQALSSAVPGNSLAVAQGSQKGAALLLDSALASFNTGTDVSRRRGRGGYCCWTPHLRP